MLDLHETLRTVSNHDDVGHQNCSLQKQNTLAHNKAWHHFNMLMLGTRVMQHAAFDIEITADIMLKHRIIGRG